MITPPQTNPSAAPDSAVQQSVLLLTPSAAKTDSATTTTAADSAAAGLRYVIREAQDNVMAGHDATYYMSLDSLAGQDVVKETLTHIFPGFIGKFGFSATTTERGVQGEPMPYRLRSDDYVTSLLLLSFFFVVWVIARSRRYIGQRLKNFFRSGVDTRLSPNEKSEMRGVPFLLLQTSFVLSILTFDYLQGSVIFYAGFSPYLILVVATAVFFLYYIGKIGLYHFVNNVFFSRDVITQWADIYRLSILALGLFLLPVALLVVYYDLPLPTTLLVVAILVLLVKILLFYKGFHVLSQCRVGFPHIFLYFCTLEGFPLVFLGCLLIVTLKTIQTIA